MAKETTHHNLEVTDSQARKTALVVAVVLLLIGGWNVYRSRLSLALVFAVIGSALILMGMFVPVAARAFHRVWMGIAGILGYINSRILLALLYYLLFTPYGLILRMVGRDPLDRRGPARESYWTKREYTRQSKQQFERLF